MVAAIEKRPIHRSIPVALPVSIKQKGNQIVAFAIKRREEVDEKAQHHGSKHELLVATLQLSEDAFEHVHRPRKVERHQSANDAKSYVGWDAIDREGVLQMELEDGIGACDCKREPDSRDTGDEQGQKAGHRQVNHQHFKHEDKACDGCFEDARNGSCGSTTHKHHHVFIAQAAQLTKRTAYRTAG